MNLKINYENLYLVNYEGAGNKTPVLDISTIENINLYSPIDVRKYLENDKKFRKFIKNEGVKIKADSIMLYYDSKNSEHEYVTFIAEPNAPVSSNFSDMCGNGIRALALHVYLKKIEKNSSKLIPKKMRIWAGSIKNVEIKQISTKEEAATVAVDLGPFRHTSKELMQYIDIRNFKDINDFSSVNLPINSKFSFLKGKKVGIGFNSDTLTGEPQAVILFNKQEFKEVLRHIKTIKNDLMLSLRMLTSQIGSELTFNKELFPQGININIGVVIGDNIYLSTHERNMATKRQCKEERFIFCKCSTLACGTGGAVAVNIALRQNYVHKRYLKTIHPGGIIKYSLESDRTIMIGEANKISPKIKFNYNSERRAFLFENLYLGSS